MTFNTAQKINNWIANSKNVAVRIMKYYRKESTVIYPPIEVEKIINQTKDIAREDYYFIASRQVGSKGIEEAINIFTKLNKKLYIAGEGERFELKSNKVKFLGRLTDDELYKTYAKAKGFIALAKDEDFGMTVVEAQAAGTPVVAFNGGGFKESIISGKTGVFIDEITEESLKMAINKIETTKWDKKALFK